MKVIFLDIDDVLNSTRTAYAHYGYNCPQSVKAEHGKEGFDWTAIKMLRRFQKEHCVKFVLSSTWRLTYKPNALGTALGLDIIDSTPSGKNYKKRGEEIQAWIDENLESLGVKRYAIIDDDSDILDNQRGNFVHVPRHNGLTFENIRQLANVLCVELI